MKTLYVVDPVKTCATCGHRHEERYSYDMCMLSGYPIKVERRVPTKCGHDFSGWVPKPPPVEKPGIIQRIKKAWSNQV